MKNNTFINYFEILNITEEAETEIIQAAYRTLAKKYHPDVSQLPKDIAEQKMVLINTAYEILSNESTRKEHIDEINRYKKNVRQQSDDLLNCETKETEENEFSNEEKGVTSYLIIIILCVAFLCCAIYFLPSIIKDALNNLCMSFTEIFDSFKS